MNKISRSWEDDPADFNIDDLADVVSREEWGAVPARELSPLMAHPIRNVWYIYDTGSTTCTKFEECEQSIRELQGRYLKEGGLSDIPFNFMVGGDGRIYEGRGWDFAPPNSKKWPFTNGRRIEIGYLGSYNRDTSTVETESACCDIMKLGRVRGFLTEKTRFREFDKIGVPRPPDFRDEDDNLLDLTNRYKGQKHVEEVKHEVLECESSSE